MFKHRVAAIFAALLCLILFTVASASVFGGTEVAPFSAAADSDAALALTDAGFDLAAESEFSLAELDSELDSELDESEELDRRAARAVAKRPAAKRPAARRPAAAKRPAARRAAGKRVARKGGKRAARKGGKKARKAAKKCPKGPKGKKCRAARKSRKGGKKAKKCPKGPKGKKCRAARKSRKGKKCPKGAKGKKCRAARKGKKCPKGAKGKKCRAARKARKGKKCPKGAKGKKCRAARKRGGKKCPKGAKGKKCRAARKSRKGKKCPKGPKGKKCRAARKSRKGGRKGGKKGKKAAGKHPYTKTKPAGPGAGVNWHPLDNEKSTDMIAEARALKKQLAAKRAALQKQRAAEVARVTKRMQSRVFHPLKRVPKYRGHIGLGNYMTGGPLSKPSKQPRTWLEQYQLKMRDRAASTPAAAVAQRKAILAKMDRLYKKAVPTDATFVVEFLTARGVKAPTSLMLQYWTAAKNWMRQQRLLAAEQEKRDKNIEVKVGGVAKKAEKNEVGSLSQIKKKFSDVSGKEIERMAEIQDKLDTDMWTKDYPGVPEGAGGKDNWWGCINCKSPKSTAKENRASKLDTAAAKAAAKASGKAVAAKAAKAAKGAAKKIGRPKRNLGGNNGRGKVSGKSLGHALEGAGLTLPPLDLSYKNTGLLQHLLERFRARNEPGSVKETAKEVEDKLKSRIAEGLLTPAERNELLLAKVEALEKTVGYNSGAVKYVKPHSLNVKARKSRWPNPSPPNAKEKTNFERLVDIEFGMGYIGKTFRSEREPLDIATDQDKESMDFHDDIVKTHNILKKDIVWTQFEGPGDSHQVRSNEINVHRKRFPNQPLPDGTAPWF